MQKPNKARTNIAPFINREREMEFLNSWIAEEPKNILFLYGPKSSGKTTLLYRFIEQNLDSKTYDIKHFNMRKLLLINYESFLRAFFELKPADQVKETREYDLKVFKLSVETIKGLENRDLDPFVVMEKELKRQVKKGKSPVIIIDELQALDEIYFNGQRELLKEMFNFFVAMTKESHLCHVIIASSDGYFIERIYNDSKLKKTSELMEIDYIEHDDVMEWLGDLKNYSNIDTFVLSDAQKQAMWDFFGGSCWEISNFLGHLMLVAENGKVGDENFQEVMKKKRIACRSMFVEHATIDPKKEALWTAIADLIRNHPGQRFAFADLRTLIDKAIWTIDDLQNELNNLVRHNYLSYAPPHAAYGLQGTSMEHGLLAYIDMLEQNG